MKRPLERDKLCPGSVPILHPTEWQEGTSACFSSTFTKCYSLVGHSLASGSRLALIIQAPEPCEGGMRPLDCWSRNSEVYLSMSKCLSRVVLLLLQSWLWLPSAWDWSTYWYLSPPSSLLPSVCTDPAIKPSHSERKGPLYCIEVIKQQMTYTWEVLQLPFTSQEMLHSHKMLHTGELRLVVFNPLPCWVLVSKKGLGSLSSLELRTS